MSDSNLEGFPLLMQKQKKNKFQSREKFTNIVASPQWQIFFSIMTKKFSGSTQLRPLWNHQNSYFGLKSLSIPLVFQKQWDVTPFITAPVHPGDIGVTSVHPRDIGVTSVHPRDIGVTPTEFSSDLKPCKEIIQTLAGAVMKGVMCWLIPFVLH